ncbi:hypothetical protein C8Q75DRAFT_831138 [Abortiporus biennis]|nr:hypothetical protein C8Q75DRAFT_831138 [Abortiporus biennis]
MVQKPYGEIRSCVDGYVLQIPLTKTLRISSNDMFLSMTVAVLTGLAECSEEVTTIHFLGKLNFQVSNKNSGGFSLLILKYLLSAFLRTSQEDHKILAIVALASSCKIVVPYLSREPAYNMSVEDPLILERYPQTIEVQRTLHPAVLDEYTIHILVTGPNPTVDVSGPREASRSSGRKTNCSPFGTNPPTLDFNSRFSPDSFHSPSPVSPIYAYACEIFFKALPFVFRFYWSFRKAENHSLLQSRLQKNLSRPPPQLLLFYDN